MRWEGYDRGERALIGAAERAFEDLLGILTREYTFTITQPGLFSGYPRGIINVGFFRASLGRPSYRRPAPGVSYLSVEPKEPPPMMDGGDLTGVFAWHAEYSLLLHEGYTTRSGKVKRGRPWTKETHKRIDINKTFASLFQAEMAKIP